MRKFVFNLEPLYGHRQRTEELRQKEFAEAAQSLQAEEQKLAELIGLYKSSAAELDELKEQGAGIHDLGTHQSYLEGLKRRIKAQEANTARKRVELEKKRAELVEAARERKVLEIMREKSLSAHQSRAEALELKEADDLTSARLRRK